MTVHLDEKSVIEAILDITGKVIEKPTVEKICNSNYRFLYKDGTVAFELSYKLFSNGDDAVYFTRHVIDISSLQDIASAYDNKYKPKRAWIFSPSQNT